MSAFLQTEQKDWLDTLGRYMTPFWDCQWKLNSEGAFDEFLKHQNGIRLS
jgi:hypothetical protein